MSFTPQNDETNTPQNNETNTPQNNETNTPQNNETNTPQNDETNTPQNDETNTPQNDETNTPQNDETNTPQNNETNTPQNDETNTPQNSDTNESKLKKPKDSYNPQKYVAGCLILLSFGGILCFFIYGWFKTPKTIDLTTFLQLVKAEKVVDIEVKDNLVTTTKKDGKKVKTYIESNIGIYQQLKSAGIEVDNSKVSIQIKPSANLQSFIFSAIPWVFIVILVICLANKKSNNINDFRKNIAKKSNENQPEFSFDNIGGAAQAKEELKTVIEFIQNPEYFQSLGARMPKGIILEGLPGTGKTLLAKAVASESNANFFYMSASEFVELYVGVGASRVRDLFNEAKKNQPAIIYIDELDAVGQRRNLSLSGSNQEQSNTLNQLLIELDGFESYQRIFVMASTNRAEILDAALLRPGRFDQRIVVDLPSFAERCQILEIHLQNKKVAEDVNIEDIARYTVDFSGAELANVVNKAAILAAKNKRDSIDKDLLEETTKAQGAIVPSAVNVQQLKQDISKEIVGQDAALTAIAWSVCSHYANIFSRSESGVSYGNKPNLFLYGPPGSGKTAIIKAAAKTLEVPFVEMTASGLVKEQAYMQKTLNRLLREANDDIRRAECGMVCLYGMEEITFDDLKFVQEELARVIEGDKFDAVEEGFAKNNRLIDTQNILFICELTLDGKSRSKKSVSRPKYDGTGQNATDDEILGDLGLVRRLINQFPMIVSTEVLKQEELLDILTHGDNSPVSLFERRYQDLGIQVELEQSALDVVTKECFQQGGDARLLKRLLNEILREYLGDSVSEKTVTVNGLMAEKALAPRIALKKNLNSNDGQENMVTTFEEVEKSSSETEIDEQNYLKFLGEVLEATKESNGDSKVVYPLLQQNLDLLDNNFVDILRNWATANFVEADVAEYMAISIGDFSDLIQQFPLGNKANNMEISIAGYEVVLKVFTSESHRENWAGTQNNLGLAYSDRIRGDKAENMEAAIAAYQQALLVHTQTDFPMEWGTTQNNLGVAYSHRIRGDKAENMEAAIAAYEQALVVRTQTDFPINWAGTQNNLGLAYSDRIRGDKAENMEAAIAAFQQALLMLTQTDFPMDWAGTQNNLGGAYSHRIRGDKAQNIEAAIAAYQQALLVRTQTDFPMDWATTQNNLGAAYIYRIRGDKAQNIEAAIAAYEKALLVFTQTDFPMEWAATQTGLGAAYKSRIRGDKAQNIEAAIAACEQALLVRTQTDFPIDWAMTQNNLGNAYSDRIRGDKAENVEAAIAAFQQALLVFTQTDFPMEWGTTQNNLGAAYSDRIRGDKAENIEAAIAAYQQALLVCTQTDFPINWADTQNNLGIAYRERIRGDKAQNIEAAIAAYEQALLVFTQTDIPMHWAQTQNNLGIAYSDRIRGDKAQNIEAAIAAFQQALLVYTQTDFPMEWGTTQNNLGVAYRNRIRGDKAQNIEAAIAACEQALLVRTQTDFPMEWGTTQNNLGAAYWDRIRGDKAQNIESAIAAFQQALLVHTQTDFPMEWAATQNNLGNAYRDRIRGDKAQNIEAAIAACQQALLVRTQTNFPMDWARAQNNLGTAYRERIRGDKAQNIESAIAAYEQALLVHTQTNFPMDWARAQNNLGTAYCERIRGDKAQNIESAIAAYEQALQVRTQTDFPMEWAGAQNNLGNAYSDRIRGDKAQNIEAAIAACQQALLVYTQTDFPMEWAMTQNNLGAAYSDRIRGDKAQNIEAAIAVYEQALLVLTQTDFPMDWAMTQNNLGIAYIKRIRGDKAQNIEAAIAACQQALLVYTQTDFPMEWARTQNNLGIAYRYRIRGDKAQNIEAAIAAYQQALLVHTQTDFPMDWARAKNNLGTAYCKRIRGDKAQNIEAAIAAYQQALLVLTLEADPISHLRTTNNSGNLYFANQNWQLAADNYEKSITAVEFSRSWATTDDRRQEIIAEAILVYQNLVQTYINLKQWDKAIETAERSKARTLVELLVKRELYPKGNIPQEIIPELDRLRRNIPSLERQLQIVIEQRSAKSGKSEVQEQQPLETSQKHLQQELQKSRQELDEVLNQIKDIDPSFTLTERVEPIPFRDIQNLLEQNTAMIEWYISRDKITTFIITANSHYPIVEQSSAKDLETLINWTNNYLKGYYLEKEQWINDLAPSLKDLAKILNIDRLLTQINNIFEKQKIKCNRLLLIPHQFLHLLPLHMMPLENGELVIERFNRGVSYAPSSQILQLTQKQKRPHFSQLFAVQNPTEDLIYADLEVETIRHDFNSSQVLIRKDASETKVKTNPHFQSSHCSHFSCHGNFNFDLAYASGLSLAKDDSQEDSQLTLAEIFGLNLGQCRLVTLSACETGLTDLNSDSDEYIGLPSGFIFAGSPSVVCSLWEVDQVSTAFLLIKFYQNLKSYPELGEGTVGIALKAAQMWLKNLTRKEGEEFLEKILPYIDIIYEGKPEKRKTKFINGAKKRINSQPHPFSSPFYWAAFTAVGF